MSDPSAPFGAPVAARPEVPRPALPRSVGALPRPESMLPLATALAGLAGAATAEDVAAVAAAGALEISAGRGAALGVLDDGSVLLVGARGYDCDTMAPGSRLPLDAGLPLTEAVRTGRTVVRGGSGAPAWVAAVVATPTVRGGLLVSLHPGADPDVGALEWLAGATGQALARVTATAEREPGARQVTVHPPAWLEAAAVVEPAGGGPGRAAGDVVMVLPGGSEDVAWLVVADACGGGGAAAASAGQFRDVTLALVRDDMGPDALLTAVDAVLRRDPVADRFVTAAAVRLRRDAAAVEAAVATAGHPPVLVRRAGGVEFVGGGGLPLNLGLTGLPRVAETPTLVRLAPGDVVLAHTDGLVDRGTADRTDVLTDLFDRGAALGDPDAIIDLLVAAMTAAAEPPRDDLALLVARIR